MYVYLLIPLRVTRISSRFWIFPLFSCIYYLLLFLHYFLHISCSCCLFYFLPYPTFFISFLSSYSVLLYSLSLSLVLSPPLSTSVSLSFIIFSLSSLFLSSPPPLFFFACAPFFSDPFYFRYQFFSSSSFLIQYVYYPSPNRSKLIN